MQKIKNNLLYIIIILFPIIDIITSLCIRFTSIAISPSLIAKGLFLTFAILYTFKVKELKYRKESIIFYFISIIFFIVYIIFKINYLNFYSIVYELSIFFKYWYFPIITLFLLNIYESSKLDVSKLLTVIDINLLTYSLGIIIPKLTNTAFSSYSYGNSGIVGWFYAANEISAIMIMLFSMKFININKEENYIKKSVISILTIIALSLIGTKVVTFSLIIIIVISLIMSLIRNKFRVKNKDLIYTIIIFIIGITITLQSNTISNVLSRIDLNKTPKQSISTPIEKPQNNNKPNVEKKSDTLIGMLFSGRDIYLKNTYQIYKNGNIKDKLFGLGFVNKNNDVSKLIEIDLFDIIFCYGVIGSLVYFGIIIWHMIVIIKNIFKNKIFNVEIIECTLFIGLVFGISTTSGHVLGAPSVSLYLAILILILYHLTTKRKEITKCN